jgi:hypothetical protein
MLTLTPVKSYTFQIILFPLQLYTYFFGRWTQSCLGSTSYIPKSTFPLGMKLAFLDLALKKFSTWFCWATFLRIPSTSSESVRKCKCKDHALLLLLELEVEVERAKGRQIRAWMRIQNTHTSSHISYGAKKGVVFSGLNGS